MMGGTSVGFALLALALAAIPVSRVRFGDYFPPATLFVVAWSATLGLFFLRLLPYPPLSSATTVLLGGAVCLFVAGTALGRWLARGPADTRASGTWGMSANAWVLTYSALGLSGVAWYLWLVAVTLGSSAIDNPSSVRAALGTYKIPSAFLFLEFFCIVAPLLACALWLSGERLSRRAVSGALLCAVATWLTTDRTQFFTLVLGAFFVFVFSRGPRLSWSRLALTIVAAGILLAANFLIIGALLGKSPGNLGVGLQLPTSQSASTPVAEPTAAGPAPAAPTVSGLTSRLSRLLSKGSTLYLYASGSYAALNTLIEEPGPRTNGVFTIYPFARLLERLGVIQGPVPSYIPFNSPLRLQGVSKDIQFNGYTFLVYPLFDFGIGGAIVYAGVAGLLSGAAYGWARRRRETALAMLLMGHLSIALTLSIFVNKFNNTASWYIALASMLPLLGGAVRRHLSRP